MMWSMKNLRGYSVRATDDTLGSVRDFLFDDQDWIVRYLVVDTSRWLMGRRVLITPNALGRPDADSMEFPVSLTKQQVKDSPSLETDKPVSRQYEDALHAHFGWAPYWSAPLLTEGVPPTTAGMMAGGMPPAREAAAAALEQEHGDPNLRSAHEVVDYTIRASDGDIGHVEDLLVDEAGWSIRYMVVDTKIWWAGKKVLVAPGWVTGIRWADRAVEVGQTREAIKAGPEYDPAVPLERAYEQRLYEHYSRIPYW